MENIKKEKPKKFPISINDTGLRFKVKAAAARANKTMGNWLEEAIKMALELEEDGK